ncbi:MAG: 4Fe-4S binding protein [Eubacteriaceae bacterium]|jgi:ferredoxin|nr:4Fe-4S binding protein [Eubacteriaceae bacterium]
MKIKKVYAVYFSPTGSSKKGVLSMAQELASQMGAVMHEVNLTIPNKIAFPQEFGAEDVVVFGAPVYNGRLYIGSVERFARLKGVQTPCIVSVTYGNRHYDDALLEMYDLVKENGFLPFAAATLVAQHTFGDIQRGRPNEKDLKENREFAVRATKKLLKEKSVLEKVPGNKPYKEGGGGGSFVPQTKENCIGCGLCAENCPQQAICATDGYSIDPTRCISCFACIKYCPVNAKCMETPEYLAFAKKFSEQLAARRENEYFI